jgi:hypothetical protein
LEHNKAFQSDVKASFAELAKSSTAIAHQSQKLAIASLCKTYLELEREYATEQDEYMILLKMAQEAKKDYEDAIEFSKNG